MWTEDVEVLEALFYQSCWVEMIRVVGGRCGGGRRRKSGQELQHDADQAMDAEVAKRVEKEYCCFVAPYTGDRMKVGWQEGVGDDEVEEGGLSCSRGMVGGWWRDDF